MSDAESGYCTPDYSNQTTKERHMAKERKSIKTPLFRGSFVYLAKPKEQEGDDGQKKLKYSMLIPLPKAAPATKVFIKEMMALLTEASAEKHGTALTVKQCKHYPIKNGDDFENDQFHGHWCVNVGANFKPNVCSVTGDPLLTEDEVYSGAWYKAKLSAWAYTNKKGGKGVSINIESAIKMKDDAHFGGGSDATEDFADDIGEKVEASGADDLGL